MQFFTNRDAFDAELELYSEPTLAKLMPARHEVLNNDDGAICTPSGFPFPPCIILERGESLDEFARNVEYEFITVRAPANRRCSPAVSPVVSTSQNCPRVRVSLCTVCRGRTSVRLCRCRAEGACWLCRSCKRSAWSRAS